MDLCGIGSLREIIPQSLVGVAMIDAPSTRTPLHMFGARIVRKRELILTCFKYPFLLLLRERDFENKLSLLSTKHRPGLPLSSFVSAACSS